MDSGTLMLGSKVDEDAFTATGEVSNKQVTMADAKVRMILEKMKLPVSQVSERAREVHMLPGIQNTLLSVSQFANMVK